MARAAFRERYGPWALVAGGSGGIGLAFAHAAARRGLHVALIARRQSQLEQAAAEIGRAYSVDARAIVLDLAAPHALSRVQSELADREIGLVIYNAALSLTRPFLAAALEEHLRELDINCRGPLSLAYTFGGRMVRRGRGGIILMSSLAGFQGGPWIANYAATKAYNTVLAEGLWAELGPSGVDVLACCAGAVTSEGYASAAPRRTSFFAPSPLTPRQVAEEALDQLGRTPSFTPGRAYGVVGAIVQRLPRRVAIQLMERNTRGLGRT